MTVSRANYLRSAALLDMLEKDLGGTVGLPLELDGSDVAPTSGTATVYRPDGSELQTGAVSIVGDEAQVEITAATLADEDYSVNYYIIWVLDFAGTERRLKTRLGVVLFAPVCPVSDASLSRFRPTLKARVLRGTGNNSLQNWIDIGWERVQRWLLKKGSRAELVVDMSELYELTEAWILWEIYADAALGSQDPAGALAVERARWKDQTKALQDSLTLTYDTSQSGQASEVRSGAGSVWLCANGSTQSVF